jgi:hypothetical protein
LVANLARPGGNMTGVNLLSIELQVKRLGVLNELNQNGSSPGSAGEAAKV